MKDTSSNAIHVCMISRLRRGVDEIFTLLGPVAYPGILFGGVQQIQLRTEDRENGDLGAVAHSQGF